MNKLTVGGEFVNRFSPLLKFVQGGEEERVALQVGQNSSTHSGLKPC